MTDTIYTSQTPANDIADAEGNPRSIGMRFASSTAGFQVVSGRSWVPSTGLAATAVWQLWDITGTPVLLSQVDLHTLPAPTASAWMPVPIPAPVLLNPAKLYCVNLFCSGGADHYVFSSGQPLPVGSGGVISADQCLFRNSGLITQPPNSLFPGGYFFNDVNVEPAPIDVAIASEQDYAAAVGAVLENPVGTASEQDHAAAVGSTLVTAVGIASEQDFALDVGSTLVTAVGIASEQDFALDVGASLAVDVGVASEQDHAADVGSTLVTGVGIASEQDFALPVGSGGPIIVPVGVASEQDSALIVLPPADPCQPKLATFTWALMKLLRDCLCAKLAETLAGPVCRCSLMAGDSAIADICEDIPGHGNGQAWVRMNRLFISREFPRPAVDTFTCAGGFWTAEFEIGVLRCAVGPDNEGQPPSARQLDCETAMVLDDAYALRTTAECCIPASIPTLPGEWIPMSSGGCTGSRVTVMVYLVPGPHDLIPQMP